MKATELMIGDWIMWKPQRGGFIGIVGGDEAFKPELTRVRASHLESRILNDYFPIPLTPEILEKNGCTMVDKGDYGEWHIKENPNIPLWQHTEFIIFGGIEIHYVHELQHALRLCGLGILADNFQI